MKRLGRRGWALVLALSWLALAASVLASADLGIKRVDLGGVLGSWWTGAEPPSVLDATLVGIRVRRAVMAAVAGAALSIAGCALQALLRNPLADPYVLGVSGGASLGAIVAMAWTAAGGSNWLLPTGGAAVVAGATAGALAAVYGVYGIARAGGGRVEVRSMILAGVVLQVFLGSVVLMIWTVLDRSIVTAHIQWLTGRIPDPPDRAAMAWAGAFTLAGWLGLRLQANAFNALGSGEQSATDLGIDVERVKRRTFFLASLMTGVVVAICGLIGFVGLVVPHTVRKLVGPDHRRLLTASALGGGLFLLWSDTVARTGFGELAMPVGAITALCGGPFFLALLARGRRGGAGMP
jgi:ABC-type Fe3+-siderophore transport system permease subunit